MKKLLLTFLLVLGVAGLVFAETKTTPAAPKQKKADPDAGAFAKVTDDPKLPRVLLIGDSISIGYTVPVRELLKGKANVHRNAGNGGPTTNGLAHLTAWLGEGKWDVIHFNWGLHDLKFMPDGKQQVALADYETNLRKLVGQLKATGAELIWCTTTPVAEGTLNPKRLDSDVQAYNAAARKIMEEQKVAVDDLYAFALPQLAQIQRPVNVHFTAEGSKALAKQVAASIEAALSRRSAATKH